MLACPNPQCSFALKHGHPAEYRETFTTCSDCGTALVKAVAATAPPKPPAVGAPLGPVLVTVAVAAVIVALSFIRIVNQEGGEGFIAAFNQPTWMAPTTMGLAPFLSAFIVVELIALIPALNRRRVGTFAQRRPLKLAAWITGAVFLIIQSVSLLMWLRAARSMIPILGLPAAAAIGLIALTTLLMFGATELIERRGVGNGFAVVLAAGSAGELYTVAANLYRGLITETLTLVGLLIVLGLLTAIGFATVKLTALPRGNAGKPGWVPVPASTVQPVSVAPALLSLPATLGLGFAFELQRSALLYNGITAGVAAALALLLGYLFFRPAQVGAMWKVWQPDGDAAPKQEWASRQLPRALALGALSCVALAIGPALISSLLNTPVSGALSVTVLSAIVADVVEEARARHQLGPLTAIRPLSRLTELEPALSALTAANIPAFPRAGHYRVLLGFFAPYAPVTLLVPASRAEEARAILDR
ncbi:MAG: hypothetical protein QM723_30280 [Myxococcaceae bacterium]